LSGRVAEHVDGPTVSGNVEMMNSLPSDAVVAEPPAMGLKHLEQAKRALMIGRSSWGHQRALHEEATGSALLGCRDLNARAAIHSHTGRLLVDGPMRLYQRPYGRGTTTRTGLALGARLSGSELSAMTVARI
jgi:hypothetical protein